MLNSASAKWLEVWKVTLVRKEQKLTLSQILRGPDFLLFLFRTHPRNLRPCKFFPCASHSCPHSGRWPLQPPQDLCWVSVTPGAAPLLSVLFKDPFFLKAELWRLLKYVFKTYSLKKEEKMRWEFKLPPIPHLGSLPHTWSSPSTEELLVLDGAGGWLSLPRWRETRIYSPHLVFSSCTFHLHLYIHLSCAWNHNGNTKQNATFDSLQGLQGQ